MFPSIKKRSNEKRRSTYDIRRAASTPDVDEILSKMLLDDQIGQMGQVDINMLLTDDKLSLNMDTANRIIGELGIGSVLNTVSGDHWWDARKYREIAIALNQIATKYGKPPVIWGLDSVHGANYIQGAIVTPQPINLAASFNRTMSYTSGKMASRDTRAAGINWLFSPLLGIALESKWSRVYETFGEDPFVVGEMASAMIRGIQEPEESEIRAEAVYPRRAAACAKHFVGYSMPHNGHDRSPSWIPTRHLYQYFVPPWIKALQPISSEPDADYSKAMTVMESYTEIDGVPMIAYRDALKYLLRYRLKFDGVLVTDYSEMLNMNYWHRVADNKLDANLVPLRDGSIDMSMIPSEVDTFVTSLKEGIKTHQLSPDRIKLSAKRVLQLKQDLGMLNETLTIVDSDLDKVGTGVQDALKMAQDSIILAKNDGNVLPLSSSSTDVKIHVTGPTANSLIFQSGGWSGQWQGYPNQSDYWIRYGQSVLDGMKALYVGVTYSCGVDIVGKDCPVDPHEHAMHDDNMIDSVKHWVGLTPSNSIARAVEQAKESDVVIVCVGEEAYAEKPGDLRSLRLPQGQYDLVHAIQQNVPDTTKIVLVYFGGRPRLLREIVDSSHAVLVAFLPGPYAGLAVADILSGRVNPSAKMPITYPAYEDGGGVPYFHTVSDQCTTAGNADKPDEDVPMPHYQYVPQCTVQWPFGHGLSYTSFDYSGFTATGGIDRDLQVSVVVKNTGKIDGEEVVMFFTFDDFRKTTPEFKRLRAFEKINIPAGGKVKVTATIPKDDLRFIGPHDDHHYIVDPKMKTWVGVGQSTDCRFNEEDKDQRCILLSSNNPEKSYVPACEAACAIWSESGCNQQFGLPDTAACSQMCGAISEYPSSSMDKQNEGWGWNYVDCLESVVWGMQQRGVNSSSQDCWMMTTFCRDIFRTGSLDEFGQSTTTLSHINSTNNCSFYQKPESKGLNLYYSVGAAGGVVLLVLAIFALKKRRVATRKYSRLDEETYDGIQISQIHSIVT